jgi:hypothetical protein
MEGVRSAYKILVGKPERKRPLRRRRRMYEGNIRMDHREMGWQVVYRMHLLQDGDQWRAVVSTVMEFLVAQKARNFLTS